MITKRDSHFNEPKNQGFYKIYGIQEGFEITEVVTFSCAAKTWIFGQISKGNFSEW